jgi:hypothetical protein
LRSGEAPLLEEFDKAFRIVMAESVRSAMLATCQLLEQWPPSPSPAGVADDDCAFEDVSADIPVIAQRLYNDEQRRQRLAPGSGDFDPMKRRAMMATFIVEFATAAGAPLPESSTTYGVMLADFKARALEWELTRELMTDGQLHPKDHTGAGAEAPQIKGDAATNPSQMLQNASIWTATLANTAIAAVWGTAIDLGATATADCGGRASRQSKQCEHL